MIYWVYFAILSVFIVLAGANLSKYGDVIAEKTGLGRAWIGLILLATITSLPELITGISSVAIVDVPNIALGDIMGACVFNLGLLALLDVLNGKQPLFHGVDRGHLLISGFGILIMSIAVVSILLGEYIPSLGHIGMYTPLIIITYFIGIKSAYEYERKAIEKAVVKAAEQLKYKEIPLKRALVLFGISAAVIIVAATFLPFVATHLAEMTGLGDTFMGTVFVAMVTTLPELVVSVTAIWIGAPDMAIANMLGSNMFNVLTLAVDDIFYTKGPLFLDIASSHAVTGLIAIIMTAVVIIGITFAPEKKSYLGVFSGSTILLAVLWILCIIVLYITNVGV